MVAEQVRTIRCSMCGHDYEITRVMTIDGNPLRIDDPSLWARAYCPSCGQPAQVLQQEVGGLHAQLDRTERMLDHLAPLTHGPQVQIEPALHRLQHILVLPARDPPLLGSRAAAPQRAGVTGGGPVAP